MRKEGDRDMSYLDSAVHACREAEKIVMKYFEKEKTISNKGEVDLVTNADVEAEDRIVSILRERYPDHGFIVEEGKIECEGCEHVWIIDPIDGTTNFAHNYPIFGISIALYRNKEPLAGAVLFPYLSELYTAEHGKGAWLNGKLIQVSATSEIVKSVIATGFPYERLHSDYDNLKYFSKFVKKAGGLRRSGSAAFDMCCVAAGRIDGYWELGLKTVDTAASQLILTEAGGKVTGLHGENADFKEIVASNGVIHEKMIEIITEAEK